MSSDKIISAEHLQAAVDEVLGIDPSQVPTDPESLDERLSISQPGVTEALSMLLAQGGQQAKSLRRAMPLGYVLLEAAARAFPDDMQEPIRTKAFLTSLMAVSGETREVVQDEGAQMTPTRERQPALATWLDQQLLGEDNPTRTLSLDDRMGLYGMCLGLMRVIDRQLLGAEKPVQAAKEPGRNDPCHCGSGKKYKKCHGGASASA